MIIAFDLGRELGLAYGGFGAPPTLETHKLPAEIGPLLDRFESIVLGLTRKQTPSFIVWEQPFVMFRAPGKAELTTVARQYGQAGALARIAFGAGVSTSTYRPQSLRKRFCGTAKASEAQIIEAARLRDADPKTNHEADAFLVWQAAAEDLRIKRMGRAA